MSQDPIERRMEFIIEQQAQFAADIGKLKDEMRALTGNVNRLTNQVDSLTSDMVTFRDSMLDLKDVALSLTHIVERQDEQIEENSKQIAALIERGKETDARLNTLITVVERHISGHR